MIELSAPAAAEAFSTLWLKAQPVHVEHCALVSAQMSNTFVLISALSIDGHIATEDIFGIFYVGDGAVSI